MKESGTSMLVVDDDPTFRLRLARAFRDRGYAAHEASSIAEAISVSTSSSPTHGVIDLRIGEDSGIELVRRLKELHPQIKLVMLTGYGSIATAVEAVRLGAVNYLTKPCDPDCILRAFSGEQVERSKSKPSVPSLSEVEWEHIQRVLTDTGGNVSKAAKTLRLHRRSLQRKLARPRPM